MHLICSMPIVGRALTGCMLSDLDFDDSSQEPIYASNTHPTYLQVEVP